MTNNNFTWVALAYCQKRRLGIVTHARKGGGFKGFGVDGKPWQSVKPMKATTEDLRRELAKAAR